MNCTARNVIHGRSGVASGPGSHDMVTIRALTGEEVSVEGLDQHNAANYG